MGAETLVRGVITALNKLAADAASERFALRALQDQVVIVEAEAKEALDATTLGKRLAGQNVPGFRSRLKKRAPLRKSIYVAVYQSPKTSLVIRAYGLTAMLEDGGHTKAHPILPSVVWRPALGAKQLAKLAKQPPKGSVLAFNGRMGTVFTRRVKHPGSRVYAHHILRGVLQKADARVGKAVDKYLQESINRSPLR